VIAPEPGICSESVVALIDLINPVSEIAAYWIFFYYIPY
jgi:hypothetical protein